MDEERLIGERGQQTLNTNEPREEPRGRVIARHGGRRVQLGKRQPSRVRVGCKGDVRGCRCTARPLPADRRGPRPPRGPWHTEAHRGMG